MPRTSLIHWVDDRLTIDGVPGTFLRHGRYLYLRAARRDGVTADGVVVNGLQLIRTSADSPTTIESTGARLRGVEADGRLGLVELGREGAR